MPSISPIPAACSPRSSACWVTLTPPKKRCTTPSRPRWSNGRARSEEHTSELQSQSNLVCRLLLEKKKQNECWYGRLGADELATLSQILVRFHVLGYLETLNSKRQEIHAVRNQRYYGDELYIYVYV